LKLKVDPLHIRTRDYWYSLPEDRIARFPVSERDESKLLYYNKEKISTFRFKQLPDLLQNDDLLIFNNARVIQARLFFIKETGASIEIFCLEPHHPADYNLAFQQTDCCEWKCLVGNLKKWKCGVLVRNLDIDGKKIILEAYHNGKINNSEIVRFSWTPEEKSYTNQKVSFGDILDCVGKTPIPPYLERDEVPDDKSRYQTVYARIKGSVAAPTAGLHFTGRLIDSLLEKGIQSESVTLHVSAGTFRPVKSETISGHEMHKEHFEVSKKVLEHILNHKGRIISVGTTSVRTLESIHRIGVKIILNQEDPFWISQWEVYQEPSEISLMESISAVINYLDKQKSEYLQATTEIIIVPGYRFKTIQGLITNFHQPQSTLLLLIAAAVGEKWREIYEYALRNDYRFLSYGDSSFLLI
jgi:S-adenosylmethionine:tRNA ribosyltransferase-isomerase